MHHRAGDPEGAVSDMIDSHTSQVLRVKIGYYIC